MRGRAGARGLLALRRRARGLVALGLVALGRTVHRAAAVLAGLLVGLAGVLLRRSVLRLVGRLARRALSGGLGLGGRRAVGRLVHRLALARRRACALVGRGLGRGDADAGNERGGGDGGEKFVTHRLGSSGGPSWWWPWVLPNLWRESNAERGIWFQENVTGVGAFHECDELPIGRRAHGNGARPAALCESKSQKRSDMPAHNSNAVSKRYSRDGDRRPG